MMHRRFTIVVIDDDEDDQFLIQTAFQEESDLYQFGFISSGERVVESLHRLEPPDLIFLDLNMPPTSGFEVLSDLKKSPDFRHIPVIVLSTSNDDGDVNRSYALGANTYLVKPATQADLTRLASIVRLYWFSLARMPRR
jgi:CheY-like chemotaxis protein